MSSLDGVPGAESHLNGGNLAPEDEDIDAILVANVNSGGVIKTLVVNQSDQNSKADKKVQLGELACAAWDKDFDKLPISAGEIECSRVWYCSKCTNFKLSDINGVMKRGDVIWACPSCCDHLKARIKQNKLLSNQNVNDNFEQKLEKLLRKKKSPYQSTLSCQRWSGNA